MPEHIRKTASNTEINQGSILLLFGEEDAAIMRGWSLASETVNNLPMLANRMLKRRKDHEPGQLATAAPAPKPRSSRSQLSRST